MIRPRNAWTPKASLPTARTLLAVAATGGVLYAMDGVNASHQTVPTVEAFNPSTNSWFAKASSPSAHQAGVAGVINGTVFLYGGFLNSQLEAYDPASNTWITRAPNAQQHPLGAAGVVTDFFYGLGGLDPKTGNHTDSNAVEDYLSLTNTWAPAPSMPTARDGLAAAVVNGILYAIGGGSIALNVELPTNEAFVNFTLYTNLVVRVEITVRRRSIRAESRVTLAPGAKFSPLRETVSVQAGDFAVSIPPGGFRQRGSREFVYKGIVHRTPIEVTIHDLGKSGYRIGIEAVRVAGLPTRNPVRFELILGGNSGGTNVQARHRD